MRLSNRSPRKQASEHSQDIFFDSTKKNNEPWIRTKPNWKQKGSELETLEISSSSK